MTTAATHERNIDELFDEGVDMTQFIVPGSTRLPGQDESVRKVSLGMPSWMVDELDARAAHLAVSRQAIINMWICERLDAEYARELGRHRTKASLQKRS